MHRVQSDDHQVQTNLVAAKATTHAIRSRNIETAKFACFLNSLRPSLIRVVRREKIERTKRKIGIAAATNAMILKNIFHRRLYYSEGNSFAGRLPPRPCLPDGTKAHKSPRLNGKPCKPTDQPDPLSSENTEEGQHK
jgi:hypothetical protein